MANIDRRPVFWMMILTNVHLSSPCPISCDCTKQSFSPEVTHSVICENTVPSFLPTSTKKLQLLNIPNANISQQLFENQTWTNLWHLTIEDTGSRDSLPTRCIGPFAFKHLKIVRSLTLKRLNIESVDKLAFSGLPLLTVLDIRGYYSSVTNDIIATLRGNTILPSLEELHLVSAKPRIFRLSQDVLHDIFKPKPVKRLHLSNLKLVMDFDSNTFQECFPDLRMFNTSRSVWASKTNFLFPQNMRTLDINWTKFVHGLTILYGGTLNLLRDMEIENINIYANITEIHAKHIFPFKSVANGTTITFHPNSTLKFEVANLEDNGLIWLNVTILGVITIPCLRKLYLGYNGIQYIRPSVISIVPRLEILDLCANDLHVMSNYPEFAALFSRLPALTHLNLSRNSLNKIPKELFSNNKRLQFIDLSRNKLESIHFQVDHLHHLVFLNLWQNKIAVLDETSIGVFRSLFIGSETDMNSKTKVLVDLGGNPLSCNCADLDSVKFLMETKSNILHQKHLECTLEGKQVSMSEQTLNKTFFVCIRSYIIAGSIGFGVLVTLIVVVFIITYIHLRRRKQLKIKIERLIKIYKGLVKETSYLAFFCHCSEDVEFVTGIYLELERRLHEKLQTEEDLICIGDQHFVPGTYIVENIVKHVEISDVIILLISRAFCKSQWCQFETMAAFADKKPMILMFREEVPHDEFPCGLNKIYQQYVRVFCKEQADGTIKLVPNWDKVCEAIFGHADNNQLRHEL